MKIGVNGRFFTIPFSGIGQYCRNLLSEAAKRDRNNEYLILVPDEIDEELRGLFGENVEFRIVKEKNAKMAGLRKTWWEQISVPEIFLKEKVDIAFFPYASNPWTKDWYKKDVKTVVTVHDAIPWINRDYRSGFLSKLYHFRTRKAIKRADLILTVSKESKKDIERVCKADPAKIRVIYNDAGPVFKKKPDKENMRKIISKYGLNEGEYFLYAGGFDARKNVSYLIEEYKKYCDEGGRIPLVLAGGQLLDSSLYRSFDIEDERIIKTGFLKEEDLSAIYNGAKAFLSFSLQEGFNLPILEAANSGIPLILSDIAVHREIAGDNALFVDLKKGSGAAFMWKISDDEQREEFVKKAGKLAGKYSWEESAEEFINALKKL